MLSFDPGRRPSPRRSATCLRRPPTPRPRPLNGIAYVIGGRGSVVGSATDRIYAIDPSTGRVRDAGTLTEPRSDLAAVSVRGGILLAGRKHGPAGTSSAIGELVPRRTRTASLDGGESLSTTNVYAADAAGTLSPVARRARPLIYVPNSQSDTVDVIDPRTYKVVEHFPVGASPSTSCRRTT